MEDEDKEVVLQGEDGAIYKLKARDLEWILKQQDFRYAENAEDGYSLSAQRYKSHWLNDLLLAGDKYQAGNLLALLDALHICQERRLELPDWLYKGLCQVFVQSLMGQVGSKGRGNNPFAKARDSLARATRKRTVERIRTAQKWAGDWSDDEGRNLVLFLCLPDETKRLLKTGKLIGIGTTIEDAFSVAEQSLRGTFAQASLETIRKQYYTIEDITFELSHDTLVLLGLATDDLPEEFAGFGFGSEGPTDPEADVK